MEERYYKNILKAYIKGSYEIDDNITFNEMLAKARDKKIPIHRFKKKENLPRVHKVIGMLKGLHPENLLDIGSGRGAYLWSLLDAMPHLKITAIDIKDYRVDDINKVKKGGISNIEAHIMDTRKMQFKDGQFDVVTALEVIEHIPEYMTAIKEMIRTAKEYIILSVPSKEDNNPEHIHFFTKKEIEQKFAGFKFSKLDITYVRNHMIILIKL